MVIIFIYIWKRFFEQIFLNFFYNEAFIIVLIIHCKFLFIYIVLNRVTETLGIIKALYLFISILKNIISSAKFIKVKKKDKFKANKIR